MELAREGKSCIIPSVVCGIDEVGRGAVAGPLVMAGVILLRPIEGITDSKKLTPARRKELAVQIVANSRFYLAWIDAQLIDRHGLGWAIREGLERIKANLPAERYLFDGNSTFGVRKIEPIVKGDLLHPEIGAASILAKHYRDTYMIQLAQLYPEYGWDRNKGYPTPDHKRAIEKFGYTPHHRRSWELK
jgi:ribonuclease HII